MNEVYNKLMKCYDSVKSKTDFTPQVALVLGSGLGDYADSIKIVSEIEYNSRLQNSVPLHFPTAFPVSSCVYNR